MFKYRLATPQDLADIRLLMESSIKKVLGKMLDNAQLEASYESMGLDTQLIEDNSYFLVFSKDHLIGSGGFSYRKTLFGGNHTPNRSDDFLKPGVDAAKIRAMYTHPDWTRKGVGSLILELSENSSLEMGFDKCELMATVSGILMYEKKGYELIEKVEYKSKAGNTVPMFKMLKTL